MGKPITVVSVASAAIAVVVLVALMASFSVDRSSANRNKAPFDVSIANLHLRIPKSPDIYQPDVVVGPGRQTLVLDLCPQEQGQETGLLCRDFPAYLRRPGNGVSTFITEAKPTPQFPQLREAPRDTPPPGPFPLLQIPKVLRDTKPDGNEKAHVLSPLRSTVFGDGTLVTTSANWPIADCATHPLGNRFCNIGFLVGGAFVEAHFFAAKGVTLNQREVWTIARAIDDVVRRMVVSP